MKEETKSAVDLAHSRECTKELISGLPIFGSMETFGARAEERNVLGKKTAADALPLALLSGLLFVFCGQCNTGVLHCSQESVALRRKLTGFVSSRYLSPAWDLYHR